MIAVVDSGATKAHWRVMDECGIMASFETEGLNPFHVNPSSFAGIVEGAIPKKVKVESIKKVFFYGAGCATQHMVQQVVQGLASYFTNAEVEVYSDILGAARALFGNSSGLVVILGTGASVGFYNGEEVERKTPSLGYALGDEGSGAFLGKELLKRWQYGDLSADTIKELSAFCSFSLPEILEKVYSQPNGGKFLAGYVPFIAKHSHYPDIENLIRCSFKQLVHNHLEKYPQFSKIEIGIVGSVGYVFADQIKAIVEEAGGKVYSFVRYPIDYLCSYHTKQLKGNL